MNCSIIMYQYVGMKCSMRNEKCGDRNVALFLCHKINYYRMEVMIIAEGVWNYGRKRTDTKGDNPYAYAD